MLLLKRTPTARPPASEITVQMSTPPARIPLEYQPPLDVIALGVAGAVYAFAPHFVHTLLSPEGWILGAPFSHHTHLCMGYSMLFLAFVRFNRTDPLRASSSETYFTANTHVGVVNHGPEEYYDTAAKNKR